MIKSDVEFGFFRDVTYQINTNRENHLKNQEKRLKPLKSTHIMLVLFQ